jgi:methyl-accepting chemotaxis protein|tara:strand:- start:1182 stop:2444 length:1263 start_codon:yes stop_codon:yes gene_type:complete
MTSKVNNPKAKSGKTKPNPSNISPLIKKVSVISDSTKLLSKEVKAMSKIFTENQKILVSMKNMIDTLSLTIEQIQVQEKKLNLIEGDNERLFEGLEQVRNQSNIISKINTQTNELQERVEKISKINENSPNSNELMEKIDQSFDSIKNNSKMIIKIADRVENVKEDLNNVSSKAEPISKITAKMENMTDNIRSMRQKTSDLGNNIKNFQKKLDSIASKKNSPGVSGNLENIKSEFVTLRKYVGENSDELQDKILGLSDTLNRVNSSSAEFHEKSDSIIQELQKIEKVTNKSSSSTSNEIIGLLKLSEYQSGIRMQSESKYGTLQDIEKMAQDTTEIINLFDSMSIETENKIPLPHELRQWAIGTIFDCADRWEISFSSLFKKMLELLGKDLLKETIRIQQVRDIFGIRAVDEIRNELGLT